MLFSASSCFASCGRAPIIFQNDTSSGYAQNTIFFFTGDIPSWYSICFESEFTFDEICRDKQNFFTENYIEDENGNRFALKHVTFNEINSDHYQNKELSKIFAFSTEQKLQQHKKHKAHFAFEFYPSEEIANKPIDVPAEVDTFKELLNYYEQRESRYIDSLDFVTNSEILTAPTEQISIINVEKHYDERRHVICPAGPEITHIFTIDAEHRNPFYMLKITNRKTLIVDKILVRINQDNKIVLYFGPCGKSYYFQPGHAYSIQAAPVNIAGQVGSFSKEFQFKAAQGFMDSVFDHTSIFRFVPLFIRLLGHINKTEKWIRVVASSGSALVSAST
jgi:hypothetical protein